MTILYGHSPCTFFENISAFQLVTVTRIIALHYCDVIMLMARHQVTRMIICYAIHVIAA